MLAGCASRAEFAAAHRHQSRNAADEARSHEGTDQKCHRRGALQRNRKHQTKGDRQKRVLHLVAQASAQTVAISALYPGSHHAGGPQKKGDSAGKMQKDQRTVHGEIPSVGG